MQHSYDTKPGQAVYSRLLLKIYDLLVLTLSNRLAWKCATNIQLKFFNHNVSNCHLDVGVGSGYYMNHCKFPDPSHVKLTLMDLNKACLNYCAIKLKRYAPQLIQADIYQPFTEQNKYDSISLNYVLHCLPGNLQDKAIVFQHLKELLTTNGVIFGSTILGKGIKPNWLAKKLLKLYNRKKIFGNLEDNKETLHHILKMHFHQVEVNQVGLVAFFKASQPIETALSSVSPSMAK